MASSVFEQISSNSFRQTSGALVCAADAWGSPSARTPHTPASPIRTSTMMIVSLKFVLNFALHIRSDLGHWFGMTTLAVRQRKSHAGMACPTRLSLGDVD